MRPHEGSFLRTAWAVPQTAEDARSSPGSLKPNLTFQTSKAVSLPAHRSIHDRAGIPRAPFAAGLRGFPRPQPPRPLRSSARAHLPVPPPSSAPPPALTCRRRAPPPRSPARRGGPSARYLWGGRRLRPWLPPRCAARRLVTNPYRGEGISLLAASLPRRDYARGQSYPQAAARGFSLSLAGLLRWQSQC